MEELAVSMLVTQSCLTLCNLMVGTHQAPPSMGRSRQEYWSGLPFPSPGDLPNPGIEHGSPSLQADASPSEPPGYHDQKNQIVMTNVFNEQYIFGTSTFYSGNKHVLSTLLLFSC